MREKNRRQGEMTKIQMNGK